MKKIIFSALIALSFASCKKDTIGIDQVQDYTAKQLEGSWTLESLRLADGTQLTPASTPALSDDAIRFVISSYEGIGGIQTQGSQLYFDTLKVPQFYVFTCKVQPNETSRLLHWYGISGYEYRMGATPKKEWRIELSNGNTRLEINQPGDQFIKQYTYTKSKV